MEPGVGLGKRLEIELGLGLGKRLENELGPFRARLRLKMELGPGLGLGKRLEMESGPGLMLGLLRRAKALQGRARAKNRALILVVRT